MACGILAPRPGIKLAPPPLQARSLNHWTARQVLYLQIPMFSAVTAAHSGLLYGQEIGSYILKIWT